MPKGHPALSEVQKKEIVVRVSENGERVPDLAREFNVHSKTITTYWGAKLIKQAHCHCSLR